MPTVLIVDDEQQSNLLISEHLHKAGFSTNVAIDGFKALAACKVRVPDVILLSARIPLLSSRDIVSRLNADEKTKHIPIIYLVSSQDPASLLHTETEEESLKKPINLDDLVFKIKSRLKVKRLTQDLEKKDKQVFDLLLIDPATSLKSPRYIQEFLHSEIVQCRRYKVPLSVVLLSLDLPSRTRISNEGKLPDGLANQLASYLVKRGRESDVIGRLAINEFILVLPHTNVEGALQVAERMRNEILNYPFEHNSSPIGVSASLGVTGISDGNDADGKILIDKASQALAQAKQEGGNRTMVNNLD